MRGVVAAGHPLTAEAGASVLREGGNAVDAAVCAVLASFAVESPLTGFGAGGHMMVHGEGETTLVDFFVAAPGRDRIERGTELVPVPVRFDAETTQTFYVGPASCGVPGTAAGLAHALERFGSMQLADLVGPGIRFAREGAPINTGQSYILEILAPIHEQMAGTRELYAPGGRFLREGDVFRFPELAETLERFAAEGAEPFYRGELAARISDFVAAATSPPTRRSSGRRSWPRSAAPKC
jgi:gamma-glutamyltranspeptidase/glutathione hydrolase